MKFFFYNLQQKFIQIFGKAPNYINKFINTKKSLKAMKINTKLKEKKKKEHKRKTKNINITI